MKEETHIYVVQKGVKRACSGNPLLSRDSNEIRTLGKPPSRVRLADIENEQRDER